MCFSQLVFWECATCLGCFFCVNVSLVLMLRSLQKIQELYFWIAQMQLPPHQTGQKYSYSSGQTVCLTCCGTVESLHQVKGLYRPLVENGTHTRLLQLALTLWCIPKNHALCHVNGSSCDGVYTIMSSIDCSFWSSGIRCWHVQYILRDVELMLRVK